MQVPTLYSNYKLLNYKISPVNIKQITSVTNSINIRSKVYVQLMWGENMPR